MKSEKEKLVMREPSIHITESALSKILSEVVFAKDFPFTVNWKEMAKQIVTAAKNKQLTNRKLVVSNEKMFKKASSVVKADIGDVELLNNLIFHIRKTKTKLYAREKYKVGTKEHGQLKELASICNEFCNEFNYKKKDGYTKYLLESIPKISSTLNYVGKLINMAEKVYSVYNNNILIDQDNNPTETKQIYQYYVSKIATKTGLDYKENKDHLVKFIEVRKLTDELDVPYEIFIDAQFESLAWADAYPEPSALIGDKALERLNKYMFKNKQKVSKHKPQENNIVNRLNKLKTKSDEEN